MNVLYYNWTPLNCKQAGGGGVTLYIKNVLEYFENHPNKYPIKTTFISSGFYYDKRHKETYIREEQLLYNTKSYTIVNSPILAPQKRVTNLYKKIKTETSIVKVFRDFIITTGPYDIIHFNSFEGISPKVLELKKEFPNIKFFHSMHDYGILCPKVQFWTNHETNCVTEIPQMSCEKCLKSFNFIPEIITKQNRPLKPNEKEPMWALLFKLIQKIITRTKILQYKNSYYATSANKYRNLCIEYINQYINAELVVSKRVGEIAEKYGINKNKIKNLYIGTKVADFSLGHSLKSNSNNFTLLYMGYATKYKGFFWYLDVLESLDSQIATQIDLKFAAKITNIKVHKRLLSLKKKFHNVIIYNGYTHEDFPQIINNVNLGIVPPLWEDNLPQIAIEMIANGIPVLTSNHGGAHELNTHPMFTFKDSEDFKNKIIKIVLNKNLLKEYWLHAIPLTTMEKHINQLISIYTN